MTESVREETQGRASGDSSGHRRDLHFDLSYLGSRHRSDSYRLRAAGRSYELQRHTPETLRAAGHAPATDDEAQNAPPTHFAEGVQSPAVVSLLQVHGPNDENGLPSLAALAVSTPAGSTTYTSADVAQAVVFLNPSVSVLTPAAADTVLGHIAGSDDLAGVQLAIETAGSQWSVTKPLVDDDGKPVLRPDGSPYYTYELDPMVHNTAAPASGSSKAAIYSDDSLRGTRWNLHPGVSHIDMSAPVAELARAGALAVSNSSGYRVNLVDAGPNYGVSVRVNGLDDDFVLDLTVTNSYVRHLSVFVRFFEGDGVTSMIVPDATWLTMVKAAMAAEVKAWHEAAGDDQLGEELLELLRDAHLTLQFCGLVGAESTFMGIPVSSTGIDLTFALPSGETPVGKICLLVGSLGTSSGDGLDPLAAGLGIAMTSLIDLAIPTYALISTAGEESNKLFDSIFKNVPFLASVALSVYTVAKDIITDSPNTGSDLEGVLISLADSLVSKVLTAADVAAQLASYFGAEEAEEAIPIVGWALKALAMEATAEQLAQTIGEVIASPRVVEFDLTVTMDAVITLKPAASTGAEFPATAASVAITAQYSDNTTRTHTIAIADPKVPSITIDWKDIPVGGTVTFIVAMSSAEGWGVGKGQSAEILNEINDTSNGVLAVSIDVEQQLYPLGPETTYHHNQLLSYISEAGNSGYQWIETPTAPTETAESLGSGPSGHVLEALNGITLSDDLGLLGYSWQASGLNIPPVDGDAADTELYTLQNIGFKPIAGDSSPFWPQAGYMTAPAGYSKAPMLVYLRTASGGGGQLAGPGLFFLDPTGTAQTGFHLRQVTPVTDASVPVDDPVRRFDVARGTSWGRFASLPTSLAIHSNGYVVAINPTYDNMQILKLADAGTPDAQAPWACMPLGPGTGPGRLAAPALVAIRPDQTILVLEAGNQRIQAFSRGGHPVAAFPTTDTPFWIPLVSHGVAGRVVYLSLSVDVAGYAYVLSQNGNGYDPADFNLDIYTPTGAHLAYQQGLVAAGLAVDLWRNVYTLNFQQIRGPGGRTEPSISEYIPSTPKPSRDRRRSRGAT